MKCVIQAMFCCTVWCGSFMLQHLVTGHITSLLHGVAITVSKTCDKVRTKTSFYYYRSYKSTLTILFGMGVHFATGIPVGNRLYMQFTRPFPPFFLQKWVWLTRLQRNLARVGQMYKWKHINIVYPIP